MRIYCCQYDIAWEDRPRNEKKIAALLNDALPGAGSLVLLPEMCLSGFSMNVNATASDDDAFFIDQARRHDIYLAAGLVRRGSDGRGRNQSVTFSPDGSIICTFTKLHSFTFGGEPEHFTAGSDVQTFAWGGAVVSPFVCYDLRFAEVFRRAIDHGATVLSVIADWPTSRQEHWITLLRARAIENQSYVAGCNRCGSAPKETYSGQSMIIDPRGRTLAEASDGECVIEAEIDLDYLKDCRAKFPALKDRRFG
ncbi:MAG: carbon-nitrogen family hydrolase [Phycisphaeraceae bacterium]|nr:carbon-nitrogen family hydrolase [Phycisphaeraceae bacterium]